MADTVAAALPALTAGLQGTPVPQASLAAVLPKLRASVDGSATIVGVVTARLPKLTSAAIGGGAVAATMPSGLRSSMSGDVGVAGNVAVTLANLQGTSDAYTATVGSVSAALPKLRAYMSPYAGTVGAIAARLKTLDSSVSGHITISGSVRATLPALNTSLLGTAVAFATVRATLPSLTALFRGGSALSAQLLTHVMHVGTRAVTSFENYPFNSMTYFAGKYLGASDAGLHQLDDAASVEAITATMRGGWLDFNSEMRKRCDNFYLGMRADGPVTLRVGVDENDPYEYEVDPLSISTLKQRRSLVGKGLVGKYWNFELECSDDFDYDTMNIAVVPQSRRV